MDRRPRARKLVSGYSLWSRLSFLSVGSLLSAGSLLSIGSAGSILSIGSAGSILSIGSAGGILSIGGFSLLASWQGAEFVAIPKQVQEKKNEVAPENNFIVRQADGIIYVYCYYSGVESYEKYNIEEEKDPVIPFTKNDI